MTRDEITTQVMNRLNLSSSTATTRVNLEIQERYNWVLGAVGLATSTKGTATASTVGGTRTVAFTLQRLDQLYVTTGLVALDQVSLDEMLRLPTASSNPAVGTKYAILTATGPTVTVLLENTPSSIVSLTAYGLTPQSDLSSSTVPAFPAIFHDALVYGTCAIELRKMEKLELANANEEIFKMRVGQLAAFLLNTPQ